MYIHSKAKELVFGKNIRYRWSVLLSITFYSMLFSCDASTLDEKSHYSSIKVATCKKLPSKVETFYDDQGAGVVECTAPGSWKVLVVSTDTNSWLDLRFGKQVWSTQQLINNADSFGDFPNLGAEKIEWRTEKKAEPSALIFRVSAMDSNEYGKKHTRLFVIKFQHNTPCLYGVVKTNEEARHLADTEQACVGKLEEISVPAY